MPALFETYGTSAAFDKCTIWEVARATSAAVTFFKPIKVGRDGVDFIDAGFGYNNPCYELIKEAQRVFGRNREPQILSIGTGLGRVISIEDTQRSSISALQEISRSSEQVAASLDNRYGDSGQYFRFNVDRGLEHIALSDSAQAGNIAAHTRNYLHGQSRAIDRFVNTFTRGVLLASKSGVNAAHFQKGLAYAYNAPLRGQ